MLLNPQDEDTVIDGRTAEPLIRRLLSGLGSALDDEKYNEYMESCADPFRYSITTYSPEIRKEMVWFEQDRQGMAEILGSIHKHNRDKTPIVRHWSLQGISQDDGGNYFSVSSFFQIYRTSLDGGTTSLYAVGRYIDRVMLTKNRAVLSSREVRLATRMLGTGYHVPF